jgi:hypothetical protein
LIYHHIYRLKLSFGFGLPGLSLWLVFSIGKGRAMIDQAPIDSFTAYIRFADGQPEQKWPGLPWTKAHWRYHWIKRQFFAGNFRNVKAYGFQSDKYHR